LLELSRLESSTAPVRRAPVDVGAVLKKVAELMLPAAAEKSHELSVRVNEPLPAAMSNAPDLERAVANLVQNAIKYTPNGGRISIGADAQNGSINITVADTGIGIEEAELPRIFERFYRVDRSRSREMGGTGLGLSIVKHAIQSQGGTIAVTSTPGAGSRFTITLPAAAAGPNVEKNSSS
jgi:two-component system phosphate regulon sensor histidine kinase PhoR